MPRRNPRRSRPRALAQGLAAVSVATVALAGVSAPAQAAVPGLDGLASLEGLLTPLLPGNLLISRSVYTPASLVPGSTVLPPGCVAACAVATTDGTYPFVWNNDLADSSFGITSKIYLDQSTPSGRVLNTRAVPSDQLVTSFPSKSELALNLSTDGSAVTFMGYVAPPDALDVSNSNTPGVIDPTNPVPSSYYRAVAELDCDRAVPLHRDQRLQRQQRPRGDPRQHRRRRPISTRPATPATAPTRSPTGSSSAPARRSSRR